MKSQSIHSVQNTFSATIKHPEESNVNMFVSLGKYVHCWCFLICRAHGANAVQFVWFYNFFQYFNALINTINVYKHSLILKDG